MFGRKLVNHTDDNEVVWATPHEKRDGEWVPSGRTFKVSDPSFEQGREPVSPMANIAVVVSVMALVLVLAIPALLAVV